MTGKSSPRCILGFWLLVLISILACGYWEHQRDLAWATRLLKAPSKHSTQYGNISERY